MKLGLTEKEILLSSLYALRTFNFKYYSRWEKEDKDVSGIKTRLNNIDSLIRKVVAEPLVFEGTVEEYLKEYKSHE